MSMDMNPASSFAQLKRIESSKVFQTVVIAIIILSALTIGAKTYDLPPLVEQSLSVMDNAITLFFLIEILFRFAACPLKRRFLMDGWNLFDTIVVIGSLIPLDNSEAVLLADRVLVMSQRPGTVLDLIDIDIPRPRSANTINTPQFAELTARIRKHIYEPEAHA